MFAGKDTQGIEAPDWLSVIQEVNAARPGTFGNPDGVGNVREITVGHKEGTPGRYIEDYPEALTVFPPEADRFTEGATVLVIGKTPEVDAAIDAAAKQLGF